MTDLQSAANHLASLPDHYAGALSITTKGFWLEIYRQNRAGHSLCKVVPFDKADELIDTMDQMVRSLGAH